MMITTDAVKALRDKTGAGMMDCKRALTEANGDMDKAVDVLRKSGIAKAEKKTGRATTNGKIAAVIKDGKGAIVEVLCETDFAANTDKFIALANEVAESALALAAEGDVAGAVNEANQENLVSKIAIIGENMQIRRAVKWNGSGKIAAYLHGGGRVGVMVEVEGEDDPEFLNDVCLHIAAFRPAYICSAEIPAEAVKHEKEIAAAQLAGKPANIIEKILEGKIAKWYSDVCLVNQPWIRDDKTSIAKLKPNAKIKRFVRWEVGEEL